MHHFGLDAGEVVFGYLALWGNGDYVFGFHSPYSIEINGIVPLPSFFISPISLNQTKTFSRSLHFSLIECLTRDDVSPHIWYRYTQDSHLISGFRVHLCLRPWCRQVPGRSPKKASRMRGFFYLASASLGKTLSRADRH